MPFAATWMALEIVILNEVSQTKKEKYITFLISRILKEMIQMNLFTRQKQIHRLREQTHGCWGKGWEEGIGGLGWTLLYIVIFKVHVAIFKMDNQQGSTVEHEELCSMLCDSLDGGECIYKYVWLSPFAVHLKLSQHC